MSSPSAEKVVPLRRVRLRDMVQSGAVPREEPRLRLESAVEFHRFQQRGNRRRLAFGFFFSLLVHAWLLTVTFGGHDWLPGFAFPWKDRRAEVHDLRVALTPAPLPVEEPVPPAPAEPVVPPPKAATRAKRSRRATVVEPEAARPTDAPTVAVPELLRDRAEPAPRASAALAEVPVMHADKSTWAVPAAPPVPTPTPAPAAVVVPTELESQQPVERAAVALAEPVPLEAERRELTRVETARAEAARVEAARVEAAHVEAARVEAALVEGIRAEAARAEAARAEAVRAEAARAEAARAEATRAEAARAEAARAEAARAEAAKAEAARAEAARVALAQEAERREAARRAIGRQLDQEADQRQAAAAEARQPLSPLPAGDAAPRSREDVLRGIGRQLDEEAGRRDVLAARSREPSLGPQWTSPRRYRLFGRSDPDRGIMLYAEAWSRKIELNVTIDMMREAAKRPHSNPLVTVAVRSDGSVESVTFVVSSGVKEIDDGIRNIVQGQAPFQAFPPSLARQYDVIEIRRTWHFDTAIRLD